MTNGSSPGSPTQIDFTTKFVLFSSSSSQEGQLHAVYTIISFALGCKQCYLLCVAGGASRYVLLVGIYPPLAPPDHPLAPCEPGTVEAAVPGVSGHAAAGLRAPRPPVRAAAQQEAGRQGAEGEVGEVGAGGQPEYDRCRSAGASKSCIRIASEGS